VGSFTTRIALAACVLTASAGGCGGDNAEDRADEQAATAETQAAERERGEGATTATQAQSRRVRLVPVARFQSPTALAAPPGDPRRIFVVEQGGRVRVVRGGRVLRRPFLDVSGDIVSGGEQGLLGMAFAPDYARSRRFYVHYSDRSGDNRVVEYRAASADRADAGSARLVLRAPGLESNHNGGQLAFGPDGLLYIGLGDGGGGNDQHGARGNAQNLGSLLGKILRIDPSRPSGGRPYRIPSSNPFTGRQGARGEIYSYGLRNPWRFSFDRSTGDLTIGDVGQNEIEEIDFVRRGRGRGANFGWRPFEGTNRIYPDENAPGHVRPVIQTRHEDGYCSITGGYVVRDPAVPALRGQYVYSDYCDGRIRAARLSSGRARNDRNLRLAKVGSVSSFGEDARGRVYVLSLDGPVYRLAQ
jgi:glucose/arabinose dehydrogenase